MTSIVILSDFDGTIVTLDLAAYALEVFVGDQWKTFDEMYINNEITLKECIESQYTMFKNSKEEIIEGIDDVIQFRPDFDKFIKFCTKNKLTFEILSAGLDFIIHHSLAKLNIQNVPVHAVETKMKNGSMEVSIKDIFYDKESLDFKNDLVKYYKRNNKVYYIGDGSSDFGAVVDADYTFSVKNSVLSDYCRDQNIDFKEFSSFMEIQDFITEFHFS